MSLILDALKKLDRERSSRRKGTANIAVEILKPDPPRLRKGIPLYFVAVPLVAAAITYGVMGGFSFLWKSSPPASVKPSAPSQKMASASPESGAAPKSLPSSSVKPSATRQKMASAPPESGVDPKSLVTPSVKPSAPSNQIASPPPKSDSLPKLSPPAPVTPPALSQQVPPAALSREPVRDAREEIGRVPPKIQESGESKKSATSPGEKKGTQNVIPKEAEVAPASTKKPAESTAKESSATPPLLKISGIVWHEEPSRRLAVINGMVTNEGSVIEGVKILEIFPDRVRFSQEGLNFEIPFR